MTTRFDIDAVRARAGDAAFARGRAYHQDGRVELLAIDADRVLARVSGTETYRTELRGRGRNFTGDCTCPAIHDWGFCKHLVAVALAANEAPATAGKAESAMEYPLDRVRRYLREQDTEALVAMILAMAERDPAVLRRLELAATTTTADDATLEAQLRKAATEATEVGYGIGYDSTGAWTDGVDAVLDTIADVLAAGRAGVAMRVLDRVLDRLADALNVFDDSEGEMATVAERASEMHVEACRAASPDPVALARTLFERELEAQWDCFLGNATAYRDVLGAEGLTEYRRLTEDAVARAKPPRPGRSAYDEGAALHRRLTAILDELAELDDDLDARIALRVKVLDTPYSYVDLARLCLDHGRENEALKWVEEGLWRFEDRPDANLTDFAAELYGRAGRTTDAETLLWGRFVREPGLPLYNRLKDLAGRTGAGAVRNRALEILHARLAAAPSAGSWFSLPARLLVEVMMQEEMFAEAWEVARIRPLPDDLLRRLAETTEDSHPRDALVAHARRIEAMVERGGQRNYEDAVRILTRMAGLRQLLGEEAEHSAHVAALKARFKAKRNFMKLLGS